MMSASVGQARRRGDEARGEELYPLAGFEEKLPTCLDCDSFLLVGVFENALYISGGVDHSDDFNSVLKWPIEYEIFFETSNTPPSDPGESWI